MDTDRYYANLGDSDRRDSFEDEEADRLGLAARELMVVNEYGEEETEETVEANMLPDYGTDAPIFQTETQTKLIKAVKSKNVIMLVGDTGSGKSTGLYKILRDGGVIKRDEKMIHLAPRTKLVEGVTKHVVDILAGGENMGHTGGEVGYFYRGSDRTKISENSRLQITTDGTFLQVLKNDLALPDYNYLVVDEAHERNPNMDYVFASYEKIQDERSKRGLKPLKLIIVSATLNQESFKQRFGEDVPVVKAEGRMYEVDSHHLRDSKVEVPKKTGGTAQIDLTEFIENGEIKPDLAPFAAAKVAYEGVIKQGKDGHILIFMPGRKEINQVIEQLNRYRYQEPGYTPDQNLNIVPFFSDMPKKYQDQIDALDPKKNPHKIIPQTIIVATNAAEAGLTVPGIAHVVDSGIERENIYDFDRDISTLKLTKSSGDSLIQRKGRAGRTRAGDYYSLFTEADLDARPKFGQPALFNTDITQMLLLSHAMRLDIGGLRFVDAPKDYQQQAAVRKLLRWGAVDAEGNLTAEGKLISSLGISPDLGHFISVAQRYGCVEEACAIASFIEQKKGFISRPLENPVMGKDIYNESSDFVTFLNVARAFRSIEQAGNLPEKMKYMGAQIDKAEKSKSDLIRSIRENGGEVNSANGREPEEVEDLIGMAVTEAWADKLMILKNGLYDMLDTDIKEVRIDKQSGLTLNKFKVIAGNVRGDEYGYKVHPAQVVKLNWLKNIRPELVEQKMSEAFYDPREDAVFKWNRLILKPDETYEEPEEGSDFEVTGPEASHVFAQALQDGKYFDHRAYKDADRADRSPFATPEKIVSFYEGRLGKISSMGNLEASGNNMLVDEDAYTPGKSSAPPSTSSTTESTPPVAPVAAEPAPAEEREGFFQGLIARIARFFGLTQ
ncbi:MAG: ATP-dependent helicase HrpA [Candidatus Gottesmanbacteria bacterium GW2011_GWC2_39_8]|uniref:ATP-dependent helicase HrpA n=1 Tax=Candidatus Gottesmanbacteria bacterium GW2011_GWC2_39_8 TaxID=1618450 RepID=A0A0G0Q6Q7_9BACT|nr:MAG: ATP-dependent helicase HrpA [Candidatus Gottesmanbacteria bacterium GW2011_GWC2_39_8]